MFLNPDLKIAAAMADGEARLHIIDYKPHSPTIQPARLPEVSLHMSMESMETSNTLREYAATLPGTTPAERALKRITGTRPMSVYEDQNDDNCAICPYCQHKKFVENEDYDESGYITQCDKCGNSFEYVTSISVSHSTSPNCRLNNSDHVGWPCSICGSYEYD